MNPFRLKSRVRPPPLRSRQRSRDRAGPPGNAAADANAAVTARAAPVAPAVAVPWRVRARSVQGVIELEHCGTRPAHSVRFALAGAGILGLSLPRLVLPGERVRAVVRAGPAGECADAADALLVVRWFEPDGSEFLWPIVLI